MLLWQEALSAAFNAASQYADTFETYREFFKENENLDISAVSGVDHGMYYIFKLNTTKMIWHTVWKCMPQILLHI